METPLLLRRSNRLKSKEQAKQALEQPNQSTATDERRPKRLAKQNEPLPEEQVEEPLPIVDPLDFFSGLPNELLWIIMNMLEIYQQFTVRRVCHRWKDAIESMLIKYPKKCLKLNVTSPPFEQSNNYPQCLRRWAPNICITQIYFEFAYKEPVMDSSERAQITIWDRAFNLDVVLALGRMLNQVQTLLIYWDTDDSEASIDNLLLLLSQFSPSVTTLGLIVSVPITKNETLPMLCNAINTHMGPLNELHLMLPELMNPNWQLRQGERPQDLMMYPPVELGNVLATNFSITGAVMNIAGLLNSFGQKLTDVPTAVQPQLESLSFALFCNHHLPNGFIATLDSNKDKLVSVKRLLLTNIGALEDVEQILKYFPNVEQLFLKFFRNSIETFGLEWIRVLKPLAKLTELTLVHFRFERKSLGWARHPVIQPDDESVNLEQLRKLTFISPYLFFNIRAASNPLGGSPLLPRLKPQDITDTISMRFPGLRQLNMWSGDGELHQTAQCTWQELEQIMNDHHSRHPGLRVNIQLGHAWSYYCNYITQPAVVKAYYRNAIAESEAHGMSPHFASSNQIIERRQSPLTVLHQGLENALLAAGFFCEALRADIMQTQAGVLGPQPQGNALNTLEIILTEIIRVLEAQVRARPDRREYIAGEIEAILRLMQLRRNLAAQALRLQAEARHGLANQIMPNNDHPTHYW